MTDSPWTGGEITATIKAGKGYDEPWLVFRGPNAAAVKVQIEEATGLSGEGISLAALTWNANRHFSMINDVAFALDATVIPEDGATAAQNQPAAPEPTPAANVAPAAVAAQPDHVASIADMKKKAEMTAYYLANKKAFDGDKDLMAALQQRFSAEDVS